MQNTWHEICAEFFPTSGYTPTQELDIEAYTDGDMSSPNYKSKIWVPIKKQTMFAAYRSRRQTKNLNMTHCCQVSYVTIFKNVGGDIVKLNRMVEIITILLNKKTVTAAELAERFNVSQRTIYRDIDLLSSSGVPIYTTKGVNGGISIMEDYSVNRAMLSDSDKNSILFALNSLQSTKYPEIDTVLEKLGGIFKNNVSDWISVDFSPWGANPNAYNKFTDIKTAILKRKVIEIDYINAQNKKSTRIIEPLRLDFKYQAWYLWGWCREREDFRTFRISRIKRVTLLDETFDRDVCLQREPNREKSKESSGWNNPIHCVLEFTGDALYRLFDDYDDTEIHDNEDGTYTLEVDFPEDEWVYGYILSFGTFVKVLEPEHIREIIKERAKKIAGFYEKDNEI